MHTYVYYIGKEVYMYKRSINSLLKEALKISPVVLLSGARQIGKSHRVLLPTLVDNR